MPRREVGAADVADLSLLHQGFQRTEGFLERGTAVPLVHLVEVDVVDAQAAQAGLAGPDQVVARGAFIVGPLTHREARLGRQHHPVSAALERLTDDLLGPTVGVDVGSVDQVDAGVEAQVELATRLLDPVGADLGELAEPAQAHRAEADRGDAKPGSPQVAVFHDCSCPLGARGEAQPLASVKRLNVAVNGVGVPEFESRIPALADREKKPGTLAG